MKKTPLKLISATLVMAIALSAAACQKKPGATPDGGTDLRDQSHSGQKIAADTPWYTAEMTEIKPEIDTSKKPDYTQTLLAGADEKYIAVVTTGTYKIEDESVWQNKNFNSNEFSIGTLTVVDRNTKKVVSSLNLVKGLKAYERLENVSYNDGKVKAVVSLFDPENAKLAYKESIIDPATGKELDSKTQDRESSIERIFNVAGYRIDTALNYDGTNQSYKLYIYSPDGKEATAEIKKDGADIGDISAFIPTGDNKALAICLSGADKIFYEVDLTTGEVKQTDSKDYSWLKVDYMNSILAGKDNTLYYTTLSGVSSIDLKTKTLSDAFNYSWCGENRNRLSFLSVADVSSDKILLCGNSSGYSAFQNYSAEPVFYIMEFTKADKNPNAGKTIMELYVPDGYVNDKVADAINKFNSTNSEYFIEVTGRYADNGMVDGSKIASQDDMESVELNSNAKLSNQLAMDLLNGTGPDILMNVSHMGQLNNSTYLVDLSKYVGTLDPEKYYTNIIDAAKVDGALYQLPLCFGVDGVMTDSKNAGSTGVGFTTAEYEKFLKGTLNGKDLIQSGQPYYFAKLFNAMREKFIVDKKADFSGPEFAALAEYVKNNVKERAQSWNEPAEAGGPVVEGAPVGAMVFKGDTPLGTTLGYYGTCYGFGSFFMNMADIRGDLTILGVPSTDGRGPLYAPHVSVAVSAQAKNVDACGEFVKLLMSEEVMESLGLNDEFVISRAANRKVAQIAVDYYNGEGGTNIFGTGPNVKRITFTKEHIDRVEKIIESCKQSTITDSAINLILIEEMQPYFSGQKDIKSVAGIAQDRVQKVLNERG